MIKGHGAVLMGGGQAWEERGGAAGHQRGRSDKAEKAQVSAGPRKPLHHPLPAVTIQGFDPFLAPILSAFDSFT